MAYKVRLADGKTLRFESKPSDEEIEEAIGSIQSDPEPEAQPTQKPSFLGRIVSFADKALSFPLNNIFSRKLEEGGSKVKGVVQSIIGNAVSSPVPSSVPSQYEDIFIGGRAAAGTAASTAVQVAPFTPGEFSTAIAGEVVPAVLSQLLPKPSGITNRFLNAPKDIREGRLLKGDPTIGEEFLQFQNLQTNDKKAVFQESTRMISDLSGKIKQRISDIFKSGKSQAENLTPFNAPRNQPYIRTRDIADSVDPILDEIGQSFGTGSPQYQRLSKFKEDFLFDKPDFMDFQTANELREKLGETIGKRFNKEVGELPEFLQAQRNMFARLRNEIGKISPEVSDMLNQQHILFDIRKSVLPDASRGYDKIPKSIVDLVVSPVAENVRFANFLNRVPKTKGGGALFRSGQELGER